MSSIFTSMWKYYGMAVMVPPLPRGAQQKAPFPFCLWSYGAGVTRTTSLEVESPGRKNFFYTLNFLIVAVGPHDQRK